MSETDRSRVEEHDKGVEPTSPSWNTEEAVPIGEIIRKLNTYRSILIWLPVFVAGMYVLAGLLLVVWLPVHKTVSLKFRLEFDGADRGEYPNSTKFSTSEIIATPILAAIHQGHSLEEYISFEDFSDAIFIREDATAIRLLERNTRRGSPTGTWHSLIGRERRKNIKQNVPLSRLLSWHSSLLFGRRLRTCQPKLPASF